MPRPALLLTFLAPAASIHLQAFPKQLAGQHDNFYRSAIRNFALAVIE